MSFHGSVILLFLAWASATGQQLTAVRSAPKPDVQLGKTQIVAAMDEPKLSGEGLAELYRKFTGRRVIVSAAAAAAEFALVQAASPQNPLTYAQAAEAIKKAAGIENFVFMPDEKDANLDFLTASPRHGCFSFDVYGENDTLPEGDSVIIYVMTFKHIKPTDAAAIFTKRPGLLSTYGSIGPLNSSVIITEKISVIRKLIELKKKIDKP